MSQTSKYIKTFTIIGIVGTLIGYVFLLYKGYILNEEIDNKVATLKI